MDVYLFIKPMKTLLTLFTLSCVLFFSGVILAGCSSAELPTNTNETGESNTNAQVVVANTNSDSNTNETENTNETLNENANTNADGESDEVDTSDWLTYTNEEYGFSVKYPNNWIYFHTVNEAGYLTYDEFITDYVRFTDKSNEYSSSSFVDITLRISIDEPKDPAKKYIVHNGYYLIFDEGTWPSEESLLVIDRMITTVKFSS